MPSWLRSRSVDSLWELFLFGSLCNASMTSTQEYLVQDVDGPRKKSLSSLRWPKVCAALKNPTWRPAGHSPLRFAASRDWDCMHRDRAEAQRSVACNRSCDSRQLFLALRQSSCCGVGHGVVEKPPFSESAFLSCRWMGTNRSTWDFAVSVELSSDVLWIALTVQCREASVPPTKLFIDGSPHWTFSTIFTDEASWMSFLGRSSAGTKLIVDVILRGQLRVHGDLANSYVVVAVAALDEGGIYLHCTAWLLGHPSWPNHCYCRLKRRWQPVGPSALWYTKRRLSYLDQVSPAFVLTLVV